jgi:hypothetical protein
MDDAKNKTLRSITFVPLMSKISPLAQPKHEACIFFDVQMRWDHRPNLCAQLPSEPKTNISSILPERLLAFRERAEADAQLFFSGRRSLETRGFLSTAMFFC